MGLVGAAICRPLHSPSLFAGKISLKFAVPQSCEFIVSQS